MNSLHLPDQVETDVTVWADEVIFTPVKLHDGTKIYRLTTKHGKRIATFFSASIYKGGVRDLPTVTFAPDPDSNIKPQAEFEPEDNANEYEASTSSNT